MYIDIKCLKRAKKIKGGLLGAYLGGLGTLGPQLAL